MVMTSFYTDALNQLCSKDQLELLDSIDRLRQQGINNYVSLPQIIVCGDQSSGKSSVLEAISGVSFPVKSSLCTRFPTELVLRRTQHPSVTVSIVPSSTRCESERSDLSDFRKNLDGFGELSGLIELAKGAMGISTNCKAFSDDLLRVEITGPDRPHLTIVDLPGLIHSETKQQSASDVELIQNVVQKYMKEPRSIILAVVSAKNDFANQVVLKLARYADPSGIRTLGVITKPDTLIPGSDSEESYVSLAKNQQVEFRLGWHVLKNMDSETGRWNLAHRHTKETEFFLQGSWSELPPTVLGIDELRSRLSEVLLKQIASELPSLINEIEFKFHSCHSRLTKLGEPRANFQEQQLYLVHISQSFQSLVKASVDGSYNDPFFEDAMSDRGYQQRLRAVVQNFNQDFAEKLATRGHRRQITDPNIPTAVPRGVVEMTRDDFIAETQLLMKRTRGRELPGTYNPIIVKDLFIKQSKPWEAVALRHVKKTWQAAKTFLGHVVSHVADAATSKALLQEVFEPALDKILEALTAKAKELIGPHQRDHPITYNHYFIQTIQQVRNERRQEEFFKIVREFFNLRSHETEYYSDRTVDLCPLVADLANHSEPDMERFAASEALGCMIAYYKVALKRFVDDVAVQVIDAELVHALADILSPVSVYMLPPDKVALIAGESEGSRVEREELTRQLEVLRKGSETCKRFVSARLGDAIYIPSRPVEGIDAEEPGFSDSGESEGSFAESEASDFQRTDSAEPTPLEEGPGEPCPEEPEVGVAEVAEIDEFWAISNSKKNEKAKKGKKGKKVLY